jgi:hypothetical protein
MRPGPGSSTELGDVACLPLAEGAIMTAGTAVDAVREVAGQPVRLG